MAQLYYEKHVKALCRSYLLDPATKRHFNVLHRYARMHALHSRRVAEAALDIAYGIDLHKDRRTIEGISLIEILGKGALLHDNGKCNIPLHILYKAGRHTPLERKVMESHTRHGFFSMEDMPAPIRYAAVAHHERKINPYPRNGSDRRLIPRSTKERRIPAHELLDWMVSLIAAADICDALTDKERKYRDELPIEKAREIAAQEYTGDKRLLEMCFERYG